MKDLWYICNLGHGLGSHIFGKHVTITFTSMSILELLDVILMSHNFSK